MTQAIQLVEVLNRYRQTRLYYRLSKGIHKHLENPSIDVEELSDMVAKAMAMIQLKRASEATVLHIGKDSNVMDTVKDIIYSPNTDNVIPTGFDSYDAVNGGFLRGSLVLIGLNSGGGKSILANQISTNQAKRGYKTVLVPLEMTDIEMVSRTISNASGLNSLDIFLKRLATGEKDVAFKRFKKLDRKIRESGGRYTIFKPKEDLTIQELLASLSSYKADVIYIDYLGLLKDADGDDQWRKMGQIARFAKQWADAHNKVVVMLVQVNEEGKLRYSQMVKEHASLAWFAVANKESKEQGLLHFEQPKSRNQSDMPFTLKILYTKMKVKDLSEEERKHLQAKKETGKKAKGGFKPDLTE
jgi:replicative DNA helicase